MLENNQGRRNNGGGGKAPGGGAQKVARPLSSTSLSSTGGGAPAPKKKRSRNNRKKSNDYMFKDGDDAAPRGGALPPPAPMEKMPAGGIKEPAAEPMAPRPAGSAMKFSNEKFADLDINPAVRRALAETFGYVFMSPVQSETLPPIMQGKDCLAKAKTGTGKTLGFLIPTIEKVIGLRRASADVIPVLILSPSRELASQIAKEAEILLTLPQMKTVTMFGGTIFARTSIT